MDYSDAVVMMHQYISIWQKRVPCQVTWILIQYYLLQGIYISAVSLSLTQITPLLMIQVCHKDMINCEFVWKMTAMSQFSTNALPLSLACTSKRKRMERKGNGRILCYIGMECMCIQTIHDQIDIAHT